MAEFVPWYDDAPSPLSLAFAIWRIGGLLPTHQWFFD